jgi:hypothetical protein
MNRRAAVLAVLAGLTCFVLGVGATRILGWGPPASAPAASSVAPAALPFPMPDAGLRLVMPGGDGEVSDAGPRILFDPDSITLLPDASLHLDLLKDAGAP